MKLLGMIKMKITAISVCLIISFQAYTIFPPISCESIMSNQHLSGMGMLADSTIDKSGYINIDCGASGPHQTSDLTYDSDEGYIATGSSMLIDPALRDTYDMELQSVRSFPVGERNCYTLKPVNGKKGTYLIRAQFMYGNYDGKNTTPTFDIYIGVNYWTTLSVSDTFLEIVHKPTTDFIYFCLVNTGGGTPFISALVLRPLNNSLYDVSESTSLYMDERYRIGADITDTHYASYVDDVYDRKWGSLSPDSLQPSTNYTTDAELSALHNDAYKVPPSIFRTGAKPAGRSNYMNYLYSPENPLGVAYFYLHFAETEKVPKNESREFNVFIDGKPISEPIKLRYLEAFTLASSLSKLQSGHGDSSIWLSINRTKTSTLPPILNAFEIYLVIRFQQSATNQNDSNAIMDIKTKYEANGVTNGWQGDPCLPKSPWNGLICSYNGNDSPRIISLNMTSMGLYGEILPSFFSLKLLKSLDLSNNNLRGTIPEFFADMPSLQELDLSGNKLGGTIPPKLMDRVKNGYLSLRIEGNANLCNPDICKEGSKKSKVLIPVLASSALIMLLITVAAAFVISKYKRTRKTGLSNSFEIGGGMKSNNQKFTYSEVINMTHNFQAIIGRGGFGTVYHGSLNNGTETEVPVAVKILKSSSILCIQSFHVEAELLMRVHHKNLVSLVGYCEEGETMALIYEYMANGNLEQRLSGEDGNILSWIGRLRIIIDAAQGLDYLHNGCKPCIVHRDMKPANILLDHKMQAKISDFGMSRIFSTESTYYISTQNVAGTPGYLDPEYCTSFRLTEKSDVYSFGIILLQLITGKSAVIRNEENVHIVDWVTSLLSKGNILKIVDKRLQGEFSIDSVRNALGMAMACVSPKGIQRPSMTQVCSHLKERLELELAH